MADLSKPEIPETRVATTRVSTTVAHVVAWGTVALNAAIVVSDLLIGRYTAAAWTASAVALLSAGIAIRDSYLEPMLAARLARETLSLRMAEASLAQMDAFARMQSEMTAAMRKVDAPTRLN